MIQTTVLLNERQTDGQSYETRPILILLCVLVLWSAASILAQDAIALRFLCFEDGNECSVYEDLLARFSEEHPDIGIVVDVVAEQEMTSSLLELMEASSAPDIARISDVAALRGQYLDLRPQLAEPEALAATFRAIYFAGLRADGDDEALFGFPDALGAVAPFVNVSLFEQAGRDGFFARGPPRHLYGLHPGELGIGRNSQRDGNPVT